jgi:hypothetical protein
VNSTILKMCANLYGGEKVGGYSGSYIFAYVSVKRVVCLCTSSYWRCLQICTRLLAEQYWTVLHRLARGLRPRCP